MIKRRRSRIIKRSINGEFPLPEALIQYIQSFLDGKEAARTSILSKSWHTAWSTRPNLDFDQRHFGQQHIDSFWDTTRKTMQRYEAMKINIESFRLFLSSGYDSYEGDRYDEVMSMAEEVIMKAMKMGTKDFEFENEDNDDYDFGFVLPREVFGSKTLTRLSVAGCEIDLGEERKVSCSGLKSLSLQHFKIKSDTLWVILSSCPSIENCILRPGYMKHALYATSHLYQLHKLKSLILCSVVVDNSFFSDLSSKFPFIKDLSLSYCGGYKGIEFSSRSLEYISFTECDNHHLRVKCDVPNIRKFRFVGSNVPSLSFKTASREWESDITLKELRGSARWFIRLIKLLDCLRLSRITLLLDFSSFEKDMNFQGLGKTMVESLKIHAPPSDCLLLAKCLLRSCRPKIISEDSSNDFLQSLWNILIQGVQGLKRVDLEVVEGPLPRETLMESAPETMKKIRCRLRWQPELCTLLGSSDFW